VGQLSWRFVLGHIGLDVLHRGQVFGLFLGATALKLSVERFIIGCNECIGEAGVFSDEMAWIVSEYEFSALIGFIGPTRDVSRSPGQKKQAIAGFHSPTIGCGFGQLKIEESQTLDSGARVIRSHDVVSSGILRPSHAIRTLSGSI
tara:strand:- start:787 stop:1224 length:438 start_codon:yes stop_codon:yes gene_type:complete